MQQLQMFDEDTLPPVCPPTDNGEPVTLYDIREAFTGDVWVLANWWHEREDDYGTWDAMIQSARSYMVGLDVPMDQYIKTHRSPLNKWQKLAYHWVRAHPDKKICLTGRGKSWEVYERGEYVEIALPYHDCGGERHYSTRDGKTKIHTNED